jgi:hypothetical protein
MRIGNRAAAVGLMISAALAIGAQPSSAAIEPPVRQFAARYRATLSPAPTPVSTRQPRPTNAIPAQAFRLSGKGAAMWQGPSSISGLLVTQGGGLCRTFTGFATLVPGANPASRPPAPALPVSLAGVVCTPQEGTGMSISGSYRTGPSPRTGKGGSGSFRAVATDPSPTNTTSIVVYLKGTI